MNSFTQSHIICQNHTQASTIKHFQPTGILPFDSCSKCDFSMVNYYKQKVQKQINKQKRKYYHQGANIALNIKKIYNKILNSPSEWDNYINNLLDNYPRHTALQEEFKDICFD